MLTSGSGTGGGHTENVSQILIYNEAEKIKAAVASVLWADEIVVVDSFSADRTPELATSLGAHGVEVLFNGFSVLGNGRPASTNEIFSLDADDNARRNIRTYRGRFDARLLPI